jgi:hypothetical protein
LASIRKKLTPNESLNKFLAIHGDKYPGFVQAKRLIKALEVVAEGEQEAMMKEQEEEIKIIKERIEKVQKDRAEKGMPPLTEKELRELETGEKPKETPKDKKSDVLEFKSKVGRPSRTKPPLDEMDKSRFGTHLRPLTQLNTIEEDLHETQTSHQSH